MMNVKRTRAGAGAVMAVLVGVGAGLLAAAPAGAAELADRPSPSAPSPAQPLPDRASAGLRQLSAVTHHSPQCDVAMRTVAKKDPRHRPAELCTTTSVLSASTPSEVTVAEVLAQKSEFSSADYASLVTAAKAGAVKSRSYSQTFNNLTDQETQYGKFYYDGSRAWVGSTYRGLKGTHICKVDWAVGYAVSLRSCSESGSTSQRNLVAHWNVAIGIKGSPVSWDEVYTMHVNAAGSIWQ
jgi:hypothetical protein